MLSWAWFEDDTTSLASVEDLMDAFRVFLLNKINNDFFSSKQFLFSQFQPIQLGANFN